MKTLILEAMPNTFWQEIHKKNWEKYFIFEENYDPLEIEIIIIRTYTFFNQQLFEKYPNLKFLIRAGTGVDNIDFIQGKKREVLICNTPEANSISAFEHTMSLIFSLLKNISQSKKVILNNKWRDVLSSNWEIGDLKALAIGVGRVGKRVADTLNYLGASVKCVDPYLKDDFWKSNRLEKTTYSEGLKWCNLLTFHCPLTQETRHYFSEKSLKKLKNPIWLVNASRGSVVEEKAIKIGLSNNKLLGVGLDVYTQEPFAAEKWCEQENVFLTPHMGAYTESAKERMSIETLQVWSDYVFENRKSSNIDERFI
ncbi:MAG: hypothetical protein K8S23_15015 [Candidatus Cloacimonetes bacterium]|nr:hypothetical protein [Candidatus Cloacimonadota bacterium]